MTTSTAALLSAVRAARRSLLRTFVPERVWPRQVKLDGAAIPVRGQPFSFGVKRALCRHSYELPERTLLTSVLEPGMHVIELGTSLGVVTAVAAERVGRTGRIVGVEASRHLAAIAADWVCPRYPHVTVLCGFGFPTVSLPPAMKVGAFHSDGASLGGQVRFSLDDAGDAITDSDVACAFDLGRIMQETGMPRPQVLVCDIEGSELVMTDPGFTLPESLQYVVIELHPHLYPHGNADEHAIIASLNRAGFSQRHTIGSSRLFDR